LPRQRYSSSEQDVVRPEYDLAQGVGGRKANWVSRREVPKNTQVVATQVLCMDGLGRSERHRRQY